MCGCSMKQWGNLTLTSLPLFWISEQPATQLWCQCLFLSGNLWASRSYCISVPLQGWRWIDWTCTVRNTNLSKASSTWRRLGSSRCERKVLMLLEYLTKTTTRLRGDLMVYRTWYIPCVYAFQDLLSITGSCFHQLRMDMHQMPELNPGLTKRSKICIFILRDFTKCWGLTRTKCWLFHSVCLHSVILSFNHENLAI